MKRNIKTGIYGWFAAAAALLATACADELDTSFESDEYATVTFTVSPETVNGQTRAKADNDGETSSDGDGKTTQKVWPTISDGTKADKLIYAVYDPEVLDDNGNPQLLEEFGNNEHGQYVIENDADLTEKFSNGEAYEITLKLKRNKKYKVAFWAQSSKTEAYDTKDLTNVRMWYAEHPTTDDSTTGSGSTAGGSGNTGDKEQDGTTDPQGKRAAEETANAGSDDDSKRPSVTPNNDELRDAFCNTTTIEIKNKSDLNQTIYLYRPLAQINVGATGYDYETAVKKTETPFAYTRIQIMTAARYLNVVEDKITTGSEIENRSALEYTYARIPAYVNYDADEEVDLTTPDFSGKEQFLTVHLYGKDSETWDLGHDENKDGFLDYLQEEVIDEETGKVVLATETFKYLSMCYILVASGKDETGKYTETSLGNVNVWIASDADGKDEHQILTLTNVPVQRNYRTNIVGEILTANVPVTVTLDPIYAGDYNGIYADGKVTDWSGPLAKDVYYDAEADEILISGVDGLLWFQRMVNGDLTVREPGYLKGGSLNTKVKVGDPYKYYRYEDGAETQFDANGEPDWRGIGDPTDPNAVNADDYEGLTAEEKSDLKKRILRATHQDDNRNKYGRTDDNKWPLNNNFHFVGKDLNDRATVKLMADIDLSGIEWIPIGYDVKIGDTVCDLLGDYEDPQKKDSNDATDKSSHRGFFGIFDGNGHTVNNMTTKKFSAKVHETAWQLTDTGPFDNVQWFPMGFFGQIGGKAEVKDLNLRNVDILSHNCAGAIAGIAVGVETIADTESKTKDAIQGTEVNITNCTVDGGQIINQPMFRGDINKTTQSSPKGRSFARGSYTGGIVGQYNASGSITDCRVSNIYINGNRSVGGIVGTTLHYWYAYHNAKYSTASTERARETSSTKVNPKEITRNTIQNSTVIADRFQPFGIARHANNFQESANGPVVTPWAVGFCWESSYASYLSTFVGGEDSYDSENEEPRQDHYTSGNTATDVNSAEFSTYYNELTSNHKYRRSDIADIPLNYVPMLSPWFCDSLTLRTNLNGQPSAYKRYTTHKFYFDPDYSNDTYMGPCNLPTDLNVDWDENSGRAGLHIEDVQLIGKEKVKDEDVDVDVDVAKIYALTVDGVTDENDCAIYVTSSDRKQFTGNTTNSWYTAAEVKVSNLLVRGNPYAYTGICLAPTTCMSKITLDDIAVYDCYYTLALDASVTTGTADGETGIWPNTIEPKGVTLNVSNANLRGYTKPGKGWKAINYKNVVFERGARVETNPSLQTNEYTLEVEKMADATDDKDKTTFTNCTFKAPFIIKIANGAKFEFNDCKATYGPYETEIKEEEIPEGCTQIVIDAQGNVKYTPDPQTTE